MAIMKWNPTYTHNYWPQGWQNEDSMRQNDYNSGLDVYETEENVVVEASLPGLTAEQVDVFYEDGILRIQGERQVSEEDKNNRKVTYKESSFTSFDYMTTLPRAVDADNIEAYVDNGIVTVSAPIAAESKPRKIKAQRKNGQEKTKHKK